MTCQQLSDKMPIVARGLDLWSSEEALHLTACAECQLEWSVVGAGLAVAKELSVDSDAMATVVLQRLRTELLARRANRSRWLVGLAAAAVIAIFLVPARLPRGPAAPPSSGPAAPPLVVHVPGLNDLGTAGLAELLDGFDSSWTETSTSDAPSLDDLDSQELERVQRAWEI